MPQLLIVAIKLSRKASAPWEKDMTPRTTTARNREPAGKKVKKTEHPLVARGPPSFLKRHVHHPGYR